jgi:hypothetical protein
MSATELFEKTKMDSANAGDPSNLRSTFVIDVTYNSHPDSGDGYFYPGILDLRDVLKGNYSLLIIPNGGAVTYKLDGIYEQTADFLPDESQALNRKSATAISVATDVSLNELTPYLRIGFLATSPATSVRVVATVMT